MGLKRALLLSGFCAAIWAYGPMHGVKAQFGEDDAAPKNYSVAPTKEKFSGLKGPISDPRFDSVVPADPDNLDFQSLGECNTCMGSNFTPSYASTPERMRGIWAYPDCSVTEDVLIQKEYVSLWHGSSSYICLEPVVAAEDLGAIYAHESNSGATFVHITNDGLMQTGVPKDGSDAYKAEIKQKGLEIEDTVSMMSREYAGCGFYPIKKAELTEWIIRFTDELDSFIGECYKPDQGESGLSTAARQQCYDTLFSRFDSTADGALDFEEVGQALFKILITHDMMNECVSANSFRRLSQKQIMDYTNMMIQTLDKDGDLMLSSSEVASVSDHIDEIFDERGVQTYMGLHDFFPFLFQQKKIDPKLIEKAKPSAVATGSAADQKN